MNATVVSLKEVIKRKSNRWTLFLGWWVLRVIPVSLDERWLRWMRKHKQYFLRNSR